MNLDDDFETLVSHQRRELVAASATDSDLELAFHLQMQEAMAASLSLQPSSSSAAPVRVPVPVPAASAPPPLSRPVGEDDCGTSLAVNLQTMEIDRFQQERTDSERCQTEMRQVAGNLRLLAHDEQFAREIHQMPDHDWEEYGDNFERPIEEDERPFRLYFKGMSSKEHVNGVWVQLAAVGVAVCDPQDKLLLQIRKPLPGDRFGHEALEMKALIEGLNAIISLGIKRIDVFTDFKPLYNHIIGKWAVKQRTIETLISQMLLLQRKLDKFSMNWLPRCRIKFAFKLAREAMDSQITKKVDLDGSKNFKETCNICLEDTDSSLMFAVDGCLHRFCFSCMKQHVEVKLLHGMLPGCPHDGCNIKLNVESSRNFLSPKLLNIMIQRIKEASIPVTEKVYCPYPKCSALMSMSETICPQQNSSNQSELRKCIKCNGSFCIKCRVPWHDSMSCYDYKRLNPCLHAEDDKLRSLARLKLWRQCVKCSHMIELGEGCFHMTCRCGYEFCYTCGAEWRDKRATCSCPLWDEGHILYDDGGEDDMYDDDDDDDDYYDDDDDYDDDNVYIRPY